MKRVLTDALIRTQPAPPAGRVELSDLRCVGLTFRVTDKGARSWSFRFRDPTTAKLGRFTIGAYPAVTLAAARAKSDHLRADLSKGINPSLHKRTMRAEAPALAFGALAERYLIEHARRKKRSHSVDDRNLRLHVLPKWRDRAYASLTRGDVIELLEGLVTAGTPILANRVQSLISKVFSFAIDAELLSANPCSRLGKRAAERTRDRVLSDDEIRLFWSRCDPPYVPRLSVGHALRLALLTGCRVSEVAGIKRGELEYLNDPQRAAWTIPAERIKNKRTHFVPLPPMALAIVSELLAAIGPNDEALIPARSGAGSITGHVLTQAAVRIGAKLDAEDAGSKSWKAEPPTAHDLRRTVETRLSSMGIPKEDRDAVLNHARSDVGSRHYDRYDRAIEKRRALNTWSASLAAILDHRAAVVVPMVRANR